MEDKGLLDQNKNSKVENGKLAENEEKVAEANGDVGVDVTDKSLLCGWRSWRPKFLQKLVNPKWFILFISIFSFTQGM